MKACLSANFGLLETLYYFYNYYSTSNNKN